MNATTVVRDARPTWRALVVLTAALLWGFTAASCLEPEELEEVEVIASEDPCWPNGCPGEEAEEEEPSGPVCANEIVVRERVVFEIGGEEVSMDPLHGDESVVEFYSYNSPDQWSANTGFEMSQRMTLIPYESGDGTFSMVFVLDEPGDGDGGDVWMYASGDTENMEIAVYDDPNSTADYFDLETGVFHWTWNACCTDGMAVSFLEGFGQDAGNCITFDFDQLDGVTGVDMIDPRGDRIDMGDPGAPMEICIEPVLCCPTEEVCDGVDNDCDGAIDEGLEATPTTCGVGGCERDGWLFCTEGLLYDTCVAGDPAADDASCDGSDSDCDGEVDEDFVAQATSCTSDDGQCTATGELQCVDGAPVDTCSATVTPEVCDGVDNDCDGVIDEGANNACADQPGCAFGVCQCIAGSCILE